MVTHPAILAGTGERNKKARVVSPIGCIQCGRPSLEQLPTADTNKDNMDSRMIFPTATFFLVLCLIDTGSYPYDCHTKLIQLDLLLPKKSKTIIWRFC